MIFIVKIILNLLCFGHDICLKGRLYTFSTFSAFRIHNSVSLYWWVKITRKPNSIGRTSWCFAPQLWCALSCATGVMAPSSLFSHRPWSYFHNTISRIFFVIPVMHIYFWSSLCTDPSPHRLLLVIPVRFKGTVKRLKEKRATCFATLLQNELNSIDVARFTNLSTTSSPGLFP